VHWSAVPVGACPAPGPRSYYCNKNYFFPKTTPDLSVEVFLIPMRLVRPQVLFLKIIVESLPAFLSATVTRFMLLDFNPLSREKLLPSGGLMLNDDWCWPAGDFY